MAKSTSTLPARKPPTDIEFATTPLLSMGQNGINILRIVGRQTGCNQKDILDAAHVDGTPRSTASSAWSNWAS